MRYRLEYTDGRCCSFANSRDELLLYLKKVNSNEISDIRKVYKNGATDSVIENYRSYMGRNNSRNEWSR